MSDPILNCVIAVQFDEVESRFSYNCESSSRGWQVYPEGSIYPAIVGRIVQFRLKGNSAIQFAGFQSSHEPLGLPPSNPWPTDLGGAAPFPLSRPYPPEGAPLTELTFDFGDQRLFYRLAVVVEGSEPIWDDPTIHDDGS